MKRIVPFLFVLLSLSLTGLNGWTDNLPQCPAGQRDCVMLKTGTVLQPSAAEAPPVPPRKTYVLPTLQEFYYPLQTTNSPVGVLLGAKKRAKKEIDVYWQTRQEQLNSENKACTELSDDADTKECLRTVREVEMNKTAAIRSINEQQTLRPDEWSLNYMRVHRQFNFDNRPLNLKCHGSGDTTNCTNY